MDTTLRPGRLLFAAALVALGVTGLVNGDFALVWQRVPPGLPGRTALAYACAAVEILLGLGLLFPRSVRASSLVLLPCMLAWLLVLAVPPVVRAPLDAGAWGGIGEIGAVAAGAWCLFALHAGRERSVPNVRIARILLVAVLPMLGIDVIMAALAAGDHVMQPWLQHLPHPAAWAMATGAGSFAASLGLLCGIWPRLAATLEAAMIYAIGLVYWAPAIHTGRTATTAFIITMLVASGVHVIADSYRGLPWLARGPMAWKS